MRRGLFEHQALADVYAHVTSCMLHRRWQTDVGNTLKYPPKMGLKQRVLSHPPRGQRGRALVPPANWREEAGLMLSLKRTRLPKPNNPF